MAILALFLMALGLNTASATGEDLSELKMLISSSEDVRMDSQDLAFFLVVHGFHATPRGGYVNVDLGGRTVKLVPNGDRPGLCDIAF